MMNVPTENILNEVNENLSFPLHLVNFMVLTFRIKHGFVSHVYEYN